MRGRTARLLLWALCARLSLGAAACSTDEGDSETVCASPLVAGEPAPFSVRVIASDEGGRALEGVIVSDGASSTPTGADGRATVERLRGAEVLVLSKDGYFPEPVVVGRASGEARVTLWRRSPTRLVMHSAGDVMMGRRYEAPNGDGEPLLRDGARADGARRVVEPVRRLFLASDVRTFNLETVVSDRDESAAYPGKRFILRMRPDALAGVRALEPTVVITANNHTRDYGDVGLGDTVAALDQARVRHTGAWPALPLPPHAVEEASGRRVAVAAFTTVDGDFVNSSYPPDGEPVPGDLAEKDRFQYDARVWGHGGPTLRVVEAPRRIRGAWDAFRGLEPKAEPGDVASAWTSLFSVYPEMQDWVARRGHGGARPWDSKTAPAAIAELRARSDLTVVQLHAGFQYQLAGSANVKEIARAAIDAGADLVVCHHPHVLQGFERYKGKLIAYSLGNFIFDQDFLSTFSSVVLRTVWDGRELLEARVVPVDIDGYRPFPVADEAAQRTLLHLDEISALRARAVRVDPLTVRMEPDELGPGSELVRVRIDGNSGVLEAGDREAREERVEVAGGRMTALPDGALVVTPLAASAPSGVELGRELFGWGRFEREHAHSSRAAAPHFDLGSQCHKAVVYGGAARGEGFLRLRRTAKSTERLSARPVARVAMWRHRLYATVSDGGAPLDAPARYSLRAMVRRTGDTASQLEAALYAFDDADPTEDPGSTELGTRAFPLDVPADGAWHEWTVDVSPEALMRGEARANMMLLYARIEPKRGEEVTLDLDDLELIEWRDAKALPARPGAYRWIRHGGAGSVSVPLRLRRAVTPP